MISVKRLLAILLCLTIVIGALASCNLSDNNQGGTGDGNQSGTNGGDNTGNGGQDGTGDGNQNGTGDGNQGGDETPVLDKNKYEAAVRIVFASNDDKVKSALDAISSSSVICRDGGNLSVSTESCTEGLKLNNKYVLVDGILYHTLHAENEDYSVTQLRRARFSSTDSYIFTLNAGPGANISEEDFESVDAKGANTVCQNIKAESAADLASDLSAKLSPIGATVSVKSASLNVVTNDGFKMSAILSCALEITVDGVVYEVTMRTYTDYDYEAEISIAAPADADKYTEVSYEEIVK